MPPMPDPKCFPLSDSVPTFQTCDKLPHLTQLEATAPEITSGGLLRLRAMIGGASSRSRGVGEVGGDVRTLGPFPYKHSEPLASP